MVSNKSILGNQTDGQFTKDLVKSLGESQGSRRHRDTQGLPWTRGQYRWTVTKCLMEHRAGFCQIKKGYRTATFHKAMFQEV